MPALPENGTRRQSLDELEQEVEKDPAKLILSPDHLVLALEQYHEEREQNAIQQQLMGITMKKKTNFESDE